jgi:DNA-binding transcriptional ArsR family regulator
MLVVLVVPVVVVLVITPPADSHVCVIIHANVNDDMFVSVWQDSGMEKSPAEAAPRPVRTVDDVNVLKAMADPTRLAILAALMKSRNDRPVMSVKELAAELGEPQTKLYRHVRQLEAAGLIEVASTRMVSGILEQRYQACQQDLRLGRSFLQEHPEESQVAAQTVLDHYRDGFFAAYQADRQSGAEVPAAEAYRKPMLFVGDCKVSPAKAAELKNKLEEIISDLGNAAEDPEGVSLNLLIGSFVPAASAPQP